MLVQAGLSLRLSGTAFQDEALYIASGHYELANLLHGTKLPVDFAAYFSGHPKLYPVIAAVVDSQFGLTGVRLLSLLFMLGATGLLYSLTRRLFNLRAGLGAAALFSVLQSTMVLGNFATYDAAAVFLLALSAWAVVRTDRMSAAAVLLAAPPAALAFGVKYGVRHVSADPCGSGGDHRAPASWHPCARPRGDAGRGNRGPARDRLLLLRSAGRHQLHDH
ncbi:ArnT family glycosyltransferase [Streptomyces phaeochromogenes]|uniref:ArnT family glycosyltransferase n=1 Tax=Streptomyces phaeochromogenes TaxID=1923 RepID=UPI0027D7D46B|nr:glycosyltransferase family 39 protein [Streptomyces phaeochromogenes]